MQIYLINVIIISNYKTEIFHFIYFLVKKAKQKKTKKKSKCH